MGGKDAPGNLCGDKTVECPPSFGRVYPERSERAQDKSTVRRFCLPTADCILNSGRRVKGIWVVLVEGKRYGDKIRSPLRDIGKYGIKFGSIVVSENRAVPVDQRWYHNDLLVILPVIDIKSSLVNRIQIEFLQKWRKTGLVSDQGDLPGSFILAIEMYSLSTRRTSCNELDIVRG